MQKLTKRQQEMLRYIQSHMQEKGTWPSFREIQEFFGFKSTNAVMGHLKALERKGCLTRVPGQARTFRITTDGFEEDLLPEGAVPVVTVPIFGNIAAGYPEGVETGGEVGTMQIDAHTAGLRRGHKAFALKVRGDSMVDAGIFEGDIVVLERRQPVNSDIVAALIDGETTLKRYIQQSDEPPYLKAENHNYPKLYPMSELLVQGVAKAVVRNL